MISDNAAANWCITLQDKLGRLAVDYGMKGNE